MAWPIPIYLCIGLNESNFLSKLVVTCYVVTEYPVKRRKKERKHHVFPVTPVLFKNFDLIKDKGHTNFTRGQRLPVVSICMKWNKLLPYKRQLSHMTFLWPWTRNPEHLLWSMGQQFFQPNLVTLLTFICQRRSIITENYDLTTNDLSMTCDP